MEAATDRVVRKRGNQKGVLSRLQRLTVSCSTVRPTQGQSSLAPNHHTGGGAGDGRTQAAFPLGTGVAILATMKQAHKGTPPPMVVDEGASSEGVMHSEEEWIHHNPPPQHGPAAGPRPLRKLNVATDLDDGHQCRSAPNVDPARSAPIVTSPYRYFVAEHQVFEPSIAGVTRSTPIFR
jgi:hypothetical protein